MRLSGAEVVDGYYEGVDVRGALAQSSRWLGTTFKSCRLSNAAFADATFDRCRFIDCDFSGKETALVSRIYNSTFEACNFDHARFLGAEIIGCRFVRCRAQHSDWSRATVIDTILFIDLRGATLNFAQTRNVDFTGANLWSAMLPFNCAGFVGNTFADREINMFLSLLGDSKSRLAKELEKRVTPWYRAIYRRLMRRQA